MDILPPHLVNVITPAQRHIALLWEMVEDVDGIYDLSDAGKDAIEFLLTERGHTRTELSRLKALGRVL